MRDNGRVVTGAGADRHDMVAGPDWSACDPLRMTRRLTLLRCRSAMICTTLSMYR
jgi:hypothetical protein